MDYTPDLERVSVSLGGYAARWGKPATMVNDLVRAEALVLRSGEK